MTILRAHALALPALVLVALALVAGCGRDDQPASPRAPRPAARAGRLVFAGGGWTLEQPGGAILAPGARAALEEALADSAAVAWIQDEIMPRHFWQPAPFLDRQREDVDFYYALTRYPIDAEAARARRAEIRVTPPQGTCRRAACAARDLPAGAYTVQGNEVFLAVARGGAHPQKGWRITYPSPAAEVAGHLRALVRPPGGALRARPLTLGQQTRPVLLMPPPMRLARALIPPPGAVLRLAFALEPCGWSAAERGLSRGPSRSDGVGFRVALRAPGAGEVQLDQVFLTPGQAGRFVERSISLARWAGQALELVLSTSGGPRGERRDDLAFCAVPFLEAPPAPGRRPRGALIVLIDTLRADALGCYGKRGAPTPAIDAFAAGAVRFENARTSSAWTLPAHASLFTSLYPSQHRTTLRTRRLPERFPTLAEVLSERGYGCAAFTGGGFVTPAYGLERGFDRFDARGGGAAVVFQRAAQWIAKARGNWFAFVHTFEVHTPLDPPADLRAELVGPYGGALPAKLRDADLETFRDGLDAARPGAADLRYHRALYAAEVACVDREFAALLGELERSGRLEDTLIVFTSDHGEEFWEHGDFGHGRTLYEEILRIPLLLRRPNDPAAGTVVAGGVRIEDIAPTIAEWCDAPLPLEWIGTSLSDARARRPLLAATEYTGGRKDLRGCWAYALLEGRDKLILAPPGFYRSQPGVDAQLFDLGADPGEQRPLAPAKAAAEMHRRLERLLQIYADRTGGASSRAAPPGEIRNQLRALGYLK